MLELKKISIDGQQKLEVGRSKIRYSQKEIEKRIARAERAKVKLDEEITYFKSLLNEFTDEKIK